jgi:hypothetical protein
MKLLLPIYDEVENLIKQNTPESLENAKSIFMEYMWGEKGENITWFKFAYQSPLMYQLEVKIHDWSYKGLKDEYDPIQFEEERIKLKARLKEAKAQQDNPSISKKYARLGIDLPLRKIFKKNMNK